METKNTKDDVKESQKVYICLFTYASTRAVHLELTQALSVKSFLLAFRRFTSRRELPATITSDNPKTYRSSSQDIGKIARAEEVWRYLANNQISCNFFIVFFGLLVLLFGFVLFVCLFLFVCFCFVFVLFCFVLLFF